MSWFYKKSSIRKLWIGGIVILLLTIAMEIFMHRHAYFSIADWFSFHAVYGFFGCVAMVLFAKFLGFFIKRSEDYYNDE